MIKEKKHRTQIDPAEAQLSSHTLSNIREKKGYAGAENDLHGKDGHVYPPPLHVLLLLLTPVRSAQKLQQWWREERRWRQAGPPAYGREKVRSGRRWW